MAPTSAHRHDGTRGSRTPRDCVPCAQPLAAEMQSPDKVKGVPVLLVRGERDDGDAGREPVGESTGAVAPERQLALRLDVAAPCCGEEFGDAHRAASRPAARRRSARRSS
jgi:hypothetical protein